MTSFRRVLTVLLFVLAAAPAAHAGFSGTDLIVPASARADGANQSHYYTTVWITNLQASSQAVVTMKLYPLEGQPSAPTPPPVTLAAGETKRIDNVIQTTFGLASGAGAIRFEATGEILVSSRTYNLPTGSSPDQTMGLFFGALPASFALAVNESTMLQAVTQGANENFRYNYGLVETAGQAATARVVLRNEAGRELGSQDVDLAPNSARQFTVGDQFPGVALTGGRLDVTVIAGQGKVLAYATQIANVSNDSSGFEMVFRSGLLTDKSSTTAEDVAGSSSSTTVSAADAAYKTGTGLGGLPIRPLAAAGAPVYDPATGLWTVQITLATGQTGTAKIGLKDASGGAQRVYNPLTTTSMTVSGQAWGPNGNVRFDFVLTGTQAASPSITINGSGSGSARGTTGDFTVSGVVLPKAQGSWPTSGSVSVQALGVTVVVTFNGTSTVTGTYSWGGQTRTFTINLATGEVTRH